jgi:CheY-like chemotaxis protein
MSTGMLARAYHINRADRGTALEQRPIEVARLENARSDVSPKRLLLIVDDYPDALEVWGLYLRSMGYDVITADNGLDAIEQAHRHHPDLIVLDLELPGISGFEAAVHLRHSSDTASIPLIAATGYSQPKQLDQAKRSGFDSIVVKPCEPAVLVSEIARLLIEGPLHEGGHETVPVKSLGHNR